VSNDRSIPSYANGFARCAAESESPGLWTGLQGLWMPSLGPTGLTLRDWSGKGNHGTLTSMDPATDWVAGEKGWALDYDGSNDYVGAAGPQSLMAGATQATIVMLAFRPGSVMTNCGFGNTNNYRFNLLHYFNTIYCQNGLSHYPNVANSATGWVHYAMTWSSVDDFKLWVNGKQLTLGSDQSNPPALASAANLGDWTIGAEIANGRYSTGKIGLVCLYNRVLSVPEIQHLHADPHALVRPRRRVFKAAVATGNRRRRMILFGASV